jgi:recombinational DNA repair protein (RecF pathway)
MTTEKCIICDVDTKIEKSTHIDYRYFYVEGIGQLCKECWNNIYEKPEELVYYEE